MFVFCGDGGDLYTRIKDYVGPDCDVYMVKGNNDFGCNLPQMLVFMIGKKKALLVHGHRQGVSYDLTELSLLARDQHCSIAFFGHTHFPERNVTNGILCLNPGSISYPRQRGRRPSFLLIEMDEQGELTEHFSYMNL